ncbi:MAG: PilZ domain-containing protein [Deltaproteobacteria bacterium]|nr:PilZ domain-containing protein [Deltaproteobacteria bacterium]
MNFKSKTVTSLLDPHSKYIFLDDEGMTEAFAIRGVEKNLVLIKKEDCTAKKRSGYFVAESGRGVIRFEARLASLAGKKGGICGLAVDPKTLKLTDRREFLRFEFPYPLPVYLRCEGKFIKAHLVNISEGGLRMSINRKLPTQIVFNFELKLPRPDEPLTFATDGLIVYCEPEENPSHFMTGVSFIAPEFPTEKERLGYLKARENLARYIGKGKSGRGRT